MITFEQISSTANSPFNYYAEDLMEQWNVALEDADLIRERRAALRANLVELFTTASKDLNRQISRIHRMWNSRCGRRAASGSKGSLAYQDS